MIESPYDESDNPEADSWDAARELDKAGLMRADNCLAMPSAIPGWVVLVLGGTFAWVTEDVAGNLARDLQVARREIRNPKKVVRPQISKE